MYLGWLEKSKLLFPDLGVMVIGDKFMIYKIRRFSTTDTPINPSEATKFKVDLNRITTQMGSTTEDPTK